MGVVKCTVCPEHGKFERGKYYEWLYDVGNRFTKVRGLVIRDMSGAQIHFSANEVKRYFKHIQCSNTHIQIYIDRKMELILVPVFKHEIGYTTSLDLFFRVSPPYREEDIGAMFRNVWEEHKNHGVVSAKELEVITPFYKIVMKGKGWRAFTSGRWLIDTEFILSENEVIFTYWYKKKGTSYGIDVDDRIVERIVTMSASDKEIGSTIIAIFKEVRIIK